MRIFQTYKVCATKKSFLDIAKNQAKTDMNKMANESVDSFYKIVDGQKPNKKRLSIRNEALVASRLERRSTVEKPSRDHKTVRTFMAALLLAPLAISKETSAL